MILYEGATRLDDMTPTSRLARDTSPPQVNSFVSRSRPALTLSNPRSPRQLSVRRRRSLSNTSPKCIDPRGLTRYHAGVPHELMSTGAEIETALNYRTIVCGVLDFRYDQSVSQLFHGHGPTPRSTRAHPVHRLAIRLRARVPDLSNGVTCCTWV